MSFYTDEQISMIVSACQELVDIENILMNFPVNESFSEDHALCKREDQLFQWLDRVVGGVVLPLTADSPEEVIKQLERV